MLTIRVSDQNTALGQLTLPAPVDELKTRLSALNVDLQRDRALHISMVESPVPSLNWHLQQVRLDGDSTLQKLNRLSEIMADMNTAEHYHLSKALDTEHQQSLDGILQTSAHIKQAGMDCYEIIPDITSLKDLGRWLVEHDQLEEHVPETLRPYLDYHSIGADYRSAHEGEFLSTGYVGIRTGAMEQVLEEQSVLRITLATAETALPLWLPAEEERLRQLKRLLNVEDFSQAMITNVRFTSPHLADLLPLDAAAVEDINTLAECLQEMEREDGGVMKFCAVLKAEQPDTFTEALHIAMDRDDYEMVPEDMDEYGKQVLRRAGADDEVIDTIDGYMDFAQLGSDSLAEDGVLRTEFGLVRRLSEPFPAREFGQTMS